MVAIQILRTISQIYDQIYEKIFFSAELRVFHSIALVRYCSSIRTGCNLLHFLVFHFDDV